MKRSLITATVALVLALLGFAAIAQGGGTTHSSIVPKPGHYSGRDAQHHTVSFSFSHGHISDFTIGGDHMGSVTVEHGAWANTCHIFCTNGNWSGDTQVHGSWRHAGSSHHYGWHANLQHSNGGETHLFR